MIKEDQLALRRRVSALTVACTDCVCFIYIAADDMVQERCFAYSGRPNQTIRFARLQSLTHLIHSEAGYVAERKDFAFDVSLTYL